MRRRHPNSIERGSSLVLESELAVPPETVNQHALINPGCLLNEQRLAVLLLNLIMRYENRHWIGVGLDHLGSTSIAHFAFSAPAQSTDGHSFNCSIELFSLFVVDNQHTKI